MASIAAEPTAHSAFQTPEERELRRDLAAAYRLVALYGWDDLLGTHLSVRIPGADHHFLLNPFGMMFDEITASSLVKVDLDGKKLQPSPYPINEAGFTIHSAMHMGREDAQCVLHLHTIAGTAVSSQAGGLLPFHQTAMLLNGLVGYHDYEGPAFDHDERQRLLSDFSDKKVMILRNHGTLAVGRTVAEAFYYIYYLERACAIQIAAQSGNTPVITPTDNLQGKTSLGGNSDGFAQFASRLAWPALLRKLDRVDPSYRD